MTPPLMQAFRLRHITSGSAHRAKKPHPVLKCIGRGCSRGTTYLHRQLTLSASMSTITRYITYKYLIMILFRYNVLSPSPPTRILHSAAKLQDVFIKNFPRASHQPAAFCPFHSLLLVLINAFAYNLYESFSFVNH